MKMLDLAKDIQRRERLEQTEGGYPMIFKDDWTKVKFIFALRWVKFTRRFRLWNR
jgi:hypothetical protein